MPNQMQRQKIGRHRYAGSKMQQRNTALALAKRLAAVLQSDVLAARLIAAGRTTTVREYCSEAPQVGGLIDSGKEPYLLVEDMLNPGELRAIEIYDHRVDAIEEGTGLCWVHLFAGNALVRPDTLVY